VRPTPIALDGAVVLVTGAARGIGRETARAFVARGAAVAVCDLDAETAADTADELGAAARPFAVDVACRESFAACVDSVRDTLGPIDVLVNNAGIMPAGSFVAEPDALTDAILDVNVRGPITGMRLVLPDMLARRRGHVVNIASLLGKLGLPGLATYVASKHAVVGLGKAVRAELDGSGVSLTTVLPPIVNTDLAAGIPLPGIVARTIRVEPDAIADAVVRSLDGRPAEIAVPRWLGLYPVVQPFVPPIVESAVRRLIGDDRALSADAARRAAYEARIARQAAP
jgi:NADP-dependent 3-hydroxy acid dehydrogenase YdfG